MLDQKLSQFYRAFGQEEYQKAAYAYRDACDYYETIDRVHVKLDFPEYYREYYNEAREAYLSTQYEMARKALDQERFVDAREILAEIADFDPEYAELKSCDPMRNSNRNTARPGKHLVPKGIAQPIIYSIQYYRRASIGTAVRFRHAVRRRQPIPLPSCPSGNSTESEGSAEAIAAAIIKNILQSNDPFLRIIDREHLEILLNEQELGMTGLVNQQTAANAGNLVGARAVLSGDLVRMTEDEGKEKRDTKKGYHAYLEKILDRETGRYRPVNRYNKVYYKQYRKENRVSLAFRYKLISSETGEILLSDLIELSETDRAEWARYDGDERYLYPGTWERRNKASPGDRVYTGRRQRRELERLLKASDETTSIDELAGKLYRSVGQAVARKLITFNPEG